MNNFIKNNRVRIVWVVIILLVFVSFLSGFLIDKYQTNDSQLSLTGISEDTDDSGCDSLIIDLEKRYQKNATINTEKNNSDYDNFVIITDKKCPFISTALTGECLDRLISQKETELKNLIAELRNGAIATKERAMKESEINYIEIDSFLKYLSMHEKTWEDYSSSFCGVKNSQIGGSAIVEESRKCRLFQIEQFIQLLEDQKSWVM